MKRATHVQPASGNEIRVRMCEYGGFLVASSGRDFEMSSTGAFSNAEECADWIRSFLKSASDRALGAQKPPR